MQRPQPRRTSTSPWLAILAWAALSPGCQEGMNAATSAGGRTLTESVEGSIVVRSVEQDDLGSVETEIVDEATGRSLAVAWHFPSNHRYDYATPLDDSGRARIRSVPMPERYTLAEYNDMLVARYRARIDLPVEAYEDAEQYRRGCKVPFAHEHVDCSDHCGNECCTSLQQCLWEVEHTGDIAGLRAVNCYHAAAMCHGTCGTCAALGDFAAVNGGDCNVGAMPGGQGEGLLCKLPDSLMVKACAAAWDAATKLATKNRRLEEGGSSVLSFGKPPADGSARSPMDIFGEANSFVGDLMSAADLGNPFSFPGAKCGCDMHPCFDEHCANKLLPDFAPGTLGTEVSARVGEVLSQAYYCARDCQLDGPGEAHACECPEGLQWCTEGTRTCADGLPAWDEYGDVARCQVSCDEPSDSACYCRDRGAVLCRASEDCPAMADACVTDQNGDGLHDHDDCEIWRANDCIECGNDGQQCCSGDVCRAGLGCMDDGRCAPCGELWGTCCDGSPRCESENLVCAPHSGAMRCERCGGGGAASNCCDTRLRSACNDGYTCRSGTCEPDECGDAPGQDCCIGTRADEKGYSCIPGELQCGDWTCEACGGLGEQCCFSTRCQDGLECENDRCVAPDSEPMVPCNSTVRAGGNEGDRATIQLGQSDGFLRLEFNTFDVPDRIQVFYEGDQVIDTGCVGTSTNGFCPIDTADPDGGRICHFVEPFDGTATSAEVVVTPNCAGSPNTGWKYILVCP